MMAAIFFQFQQRQQLFKKLYKERSLLLQMIILMTKLNMSHKRFFTLVMVGTVFLYLTSAAVTINESPNVENPSCPSPNNFFEQLGAQPSGSSATVEYEAASSFYDHTNSEYTQILAKTGNATTPFKFLYFDQKSVKQEAICNGTEGYSLVKLINNFLFLKKTTPTEEFKVCRFDPAAIVNPVASFTPKTITLPSGIATPIGGIATPINKFIPYSVRETTPNSEWAIYIAFRNDAPSTVIAQYAWTTIDTTATVITSSITNTFTEMDGVEDVIYNDADKFAVLGAGAYDPNAVLPSPSSGNQVRFFKTLARTSLIGIYASDTSASFYLARYTAQFDFTPFADITGTSTTAFKDFYDESANIMIISATQVAWLNVALDNTLLKVIANTTQINTTSLHSVSFLGKTSVFTYNNKLVTYKMTGENTLQKTFSHTTSSTIYESGGDQSRSVALSCFCQTLERLSCYSSTLNCLLIKKGSTNCASQPVLVPIPTQAPQVV